MYNAYHLHLPSKSIYIAFTIFLHFQSLSTGQEIPHLIFLNKQKEKQTDAVWDGNICNYFSFEPVINKHVAADKLTPKVIGETTKSYFWKGFECIIIQKHALIPGWVIVWTEMEIMSAHFSWVLVANFHNREPPCLASSKTNTKLSSTRTTLLECTPTDRSKRAQVSKKEIFHRECRPAEKIRNNHNSFHCQPALHDLCFKWVAGNCWGGVTHQPTSLCVPYVSSLFIIFCTLPGPR